MSGDKRFTRLLKYSPARMGLNGADLSASTNSNWISVAGGNQVALLLDYTAGSTTDLTITFNIQTREDASDTGTRYLVTKSTSSGVETISDRQISWNCGAASKSIEYDFGLLGGEFRLLSVTAGAGDDTDLLSVTALVGNV